MVRLLESLKSLKRNLQKLFVRSFSLVKLMETFLSVVSANLFGTKIFNTLVKSYYLEVDSLLSWYKAHKKLSKNPVRRRKLRKETAQKFFKILERFGAIIPKWLSALPDNLEEKDFNEWKAETEKGEYRDLARCINNAGEVKCLRENLDCIGKTMADTYNNRKFQKLVTSKIETETEDNGDNFQIGAPTIEKK